MFGKTLKVVEYNLTFGAQARMVNVFACFKYKQNGNLYVIYADVNTKYEVINYGSSHIRNNNILSMSGRSEDQEIIKEFIYKVINNEELTNFEFIDLKEITGIEIVGFNHLEIKLEVIRKLEELTIQKPKEEVGEEELNKETTSTKSAQEDNTPKKKSNKKKLILVFLIIIIIAGGGSFYFWKNSLTTVTKQIICTKNYKPLELNANVEEINTYNFDKHSKLSDIDTSVAYTFNDEEEFQDFTYRGLYYKYMPDDNDTTKPSWDNETYTFKVTYKTVINQAYNEPKDYEGVISYNNNNGYSCTEKIEEK